ncbi:MAG: hypothetical protein Q8R02_16520 [Hyphomonadaceae bacterium]|nr:hypothetical protein [Hyphomonadaceae bacterium]
MAKKPAAKTAKAIAKKKPAAKAAASKTILTLNVNAPGKTYPRDAVKYAAARKAFLGFLPKTGPGMTQTEMFEGMRKALPEFGSTSGWWMKTVQLDAEARGDVIRDGGKPLRWKRVK